MRTRKREPLDFYRTERRAVELVRPFLPNGIAWEPCAGLGDISDCLIGAVSTDIKSRRSDIGEIDFLKCEKPMGDFIITNPPFNRAKEMIQHALRLGIISIWLLNEQWVGRQGNYGLTKCGLYRHITICSLIKFITEDGRVVNGNGTGQCGWYFFDPKQDALTEQLWLSYKDIK